MCWFLSSKANHRIVRKQISKSTAVADNVLGRTPIFLPTAITRCERIQSVPSRRPIGFPCSGAATSSDSQRMRKVGRRFARPAKAIVEKVSPKRRSCCRVSRPEVWRWHSNRSSSIALVVLSSLERKWMVKKKEKKFWRKKGGRATTKIGEQHCCQIAVWFVVAVRSVALVVLSTLGKR